jgi:hypothetical protein
MASNTNSSKFPAAIGWVLIGAAVGFIVVKYFI